MTHCRINEGDYIDIQITLDVKCLHMNYDNLFMLQSHPRLLKQVFRTAGKINEQTLTYMNMISSGRFIVK